MTFDWKNILACILLCEFIGVAGSVFTIDSIPAWYAHLEKPSFTPPPWIFAPVWTILFALMGIALYRLWERKEVEQLSLAAFFIQLALNLAWSIVFFGMQEIALGLATIAALWIAIAATIALGWKKDRTAATLLLPYLAWTTFAMLLNASILALNP